MKSDHLQTYACACVHMPACVHLYVCVQHRTLEAALDRGENLDDLVGKSEELSLHSKAFYTTVGTTSLYLFVSVCPHLSLSRSLSLFPVAFC